MDKVKTISIINGVKRLNKPKGYIPIWPKQLCDYLESEGRFNVKLFLWDGEVKSMITSKVIEAYQEHLLDLYYSMNETEQEEGIVIFAKSFGGIIAEKALNQIRADNREFNCSLLIRIGTPDLRSMINVKEGTNVINIRSNSDLLFYLTILPLSLILYFILGFRNKGNPIKTYVVRGLNHRELTLNVQAYILKFNTSIPLYKFYLDILNDKFKY